MATRVGYTGGGTPAPTYDSARLCSSSIGDEKEVVTEVLEFKSWADAEERHQNYMRKHRAAKAERAADAQQWVNAWGGREGGR